LGIQYELTSHTNPYVDVGIDAVNQGFEDKTSFFYFPFAHSSYSKHAFSEFSTNAFHLLFKGALNLINPNKEYKYTTDKTYSGDSYADGYVPIFDDFEKNTSEYWSVNPHEGIEASFSDTDLLRFAYAASMAESVIGLPIMLGFQGGVGQMGIHFAKVREGHEPSSLNNGAIGITSFNDATDLYFGPSIGYVTEVLGNDLAMLLVQYDWYYFIKGIDDSGEDRMLNGNKLTLELTYFPFDIRDKYLDNLFFKFIYKTSTVPYMKGFSDKISVDYEFTKIGFGINYFIF
jgi:hypothetical protein